MKSPSSTYDRREVERGMLKFFMCFLKIFIIGERYRAEKMGDSEEPWLTPTFVGKGGDMKLFHIYTVLHPTRYFLKKLVMHLSKPALVRI